MGASQGASSDDRGAETISHGGNFSRGSTPPPIGDYWGQGPRDGGRVDHDPAFPVPLGDLPQFAAEMPLLRGEDVAIPIRRLSRPA
eukprot:3527697-Pyramimonas_sp.AAC.1